MKETLDLTLTVSVPKKTIVKSLAQLGGILTQEAWEKIQALDKNVSLEALGEEAGDLQMAIVLIWLGSHEKKLENLIEE